MDLISKLEKRFGSWAIPHLALYIIGIQAIGVVLLLTNTADRNGLILYGSGVLHEGEWWRLLSFLMYPATTSPIFLFFVFYIFYMIGNALERQWGTFRFNLFILTGYFLTVAMAFINPGVVITNTYFLGSVFLAFATLFPNIEFRLFFVLPVKVKWLGWLTAAMYLLALFSSSKGSVVLIGNKLCILAAFTTYLLFFGKGFLRSLKAGQRRKAFVAEQVAASEQPRHVCKVCGITDKSDDQMDFRYCSTCGDCFCEKHISDHKH
ncbi:hypothetical protein P4C99_06605 [Pontiellaceae bacterium B1224]|nr:hypothetical protein [Pontiellaceae bacterium B1224]